MTQPLAHSLDLRQWLETSRHLGELQEVCKANWHL